MRNPEKVLKTQPLVLWGLLLFYPNELLQRSQHRTIVMDTAYSEGDWMPGTKLYTGTTRRHRAGLVLSSGPGAKTEGQWDSMTKLTVVGSSGNPILKL